MKNMKFLKLLFVFITVIYTKNISGQFAYKNLDLGINASIYSDGYLFNGNFQAGGKTSIYSSNIWIGGLDNNGQLHLSAPSYGVLGKDLFYGPIANNYTGSYDLKYNRVWKISFNQIQNHISNFSTPGYIMPTDIQNWPGNGDIANGEAYYLAPYVDVNGNNLYDPVNGDYPEIPGDQAVFYIANDAKYPHSSGGDSLRIEIHGMLFEYSTSSPMGKAVFADFKVYNRSIINYDSVYVGAWGDLDLGNYLDDYMGCDSTLNTFYAYNADADDDGALGYGTHPPAQGISILNHPVSSFIYYQNSNSTTQGNPDLPVDYYNYLKGNWKDNTHLTYGGTGYGGVTSTDFMYSGFPELNSGWRNNGFPDDCRGVMSIGPFIFNAGDALCLQVAYPFAWDINGTHFTSIALLRQYINYIDSIYAGTPSCWLTSNINYTNIQENSLSVYPNPSSGKIIMKSDDGIENIEIYSILGQTILNQNKKGKLVEIDLEKLGKGIYIYKVKLKNNKFCFGKAFVE